MQEARPSTRVPCPHTDDATRTTPRIRGQQSGLCCAGCDAGNPWALRALAGKCTLNVGFHRVSLDNGQAGNRMANDSPGSPPRRNTGSACPRFAPRCLDKNAIASFWNRDRLANKEWSQTQVVVRPHVRLRESDGWLSEGTIVCGLFKLASCYFFL